MRVFTGLLFISLAAAVVTAQNGVDSFIAGTVTDSEGNTVAGAEVSVDAENYPGKTYKGTSDRNGSFSFMVPAGKGKVIGRKSSGTKSNYSKIVEAAFTSDVETRVDIVLSEETSIREHVDVKISTGTAQPFSEVSKTVDSLSDVEIRDRGEISVINALRTAPGFRIQQLGGYGRTASIKTRGLRNQDTAILLDGQRLRDPASITGDAAAFLSDVGVVNISRIEILRGSGSSIYGTNAIGGVVDIQTQTARSGFHGNVQSEFGGLGYTRFLSNTAYGTADNRFGFTAGISRTGFTEGIDGEDDANTTSFRGRVDARPTDRISVWGSFVASDAFVRLNSNPDTFGTVPANGIVDAVRGVNFVTDTNDPDNFQRSDFYAGQANAAFVITSKALFTASYQGLKTKRENENGGLGPGFQPFGGTQSSFFDGQVHTLNAKLDWSATQTGRLIAGYEFELEKYGNKGFGPSASGDFFTNVDQSSNAFFVQYLQSFLERRLQLAGGFRTQSFSLSDPAFSVNNAPYAGIALDNPPVAYTFDGAVSYYLIKTATKFRAHVGNGYRVPSLYERFGTFYSSFGQNFTALGDPDLEPERSVSFDIGADQSLSDGRVNLSASYFYTRLTNTIGYGNGVPDIGSTNRPFGGYLNTDGGLARGAEFSVGATLWSSTSIFSSYTYTNSDQVVPQVTASGTLRTLGIPDHRFTITATQRIAKRLSLNFDFESTSSYLAPIFSNSSFSTVVYRFSGNRRGDLTATYDLPVFGERATATFFATAENLFDYTYFENGFATVGRSARIGVGFKF